MPAAKQTDGETGAQVVVTPPTTRRHHRRGSAPRPLDRTLAVLVGVIAVALVGIRLGPSLTGQRVFLGLDLFGRFAPWSTAPGADPTSGSSIYISDTLDFFVPGMHEIRERLLAGDLAGWSDLVGGGSSLLGTPVFGVISPGRWLYLLLPTALAPGWAKLAELVFAAVFTFLLVRRLGGSKVAGWLAGFIYPLTGFMIGWNNWPQVAVGSVIPMLFWAVERFLLTPRPRHLVPVALASALLVFGGFPAVAGQTFYVVGAYAVVRVAVSHRRQLGLAGRRLVALAVGVGLGVGLTAVQVLPFSQQFLAGVDLSYRDQGFFGDSPHRFLLTTAFPMSFAGNSLWVGASPMDVNTYVGAAVMILVALGGVAALTGRVRHEVGIFCLLTIAVVVGLCYFQGGWSSWMSHLPIFSGNPIGRVRSQLGVPVALLAAAGFDALRGRDWSRGWTSLRVIGWTWPTAVVTVAVTVGLGGVGWLMASGARGAFGPEVTPDVLLAVGPLVVLSVLVVLAVALRAQWARAGALMVVVITVGAQAVAATSFYWPTGDPADFYRSMGPIQYLQREVGHDRMANLGYSIRANITSFYGLRTLTGHSFYPVTMKDLLLAVDPASFQSGPTYALLSPMASEVANVPGLDRLGVRYLAGEVDSVIPGTTTTPQPIIGTTDVLPAPASPLPLTVGTSYATTVAGGGLRGVSVPLTLTAARTTVTVALTREDGSAVASGTRHIAKGTWLVPVPLVAETVTAKAGERWRVSVTVDQPGAVAGADAGGAIQVAGVHPDAGSQSLRLVYAADGIVLWERLAAQSRIHWASVATVIPDKAARLGSVATSPVKRSQIILAAPPAGPLGTTASTPSTFDIDEDSADTTRVKVTTTQPGYVVLADNIQKDFAAHVDGRDAEIVDADYAVGAVYVPAGTHTVEITYDPVGGHPGGVITAVSGLLLVLLSVPIGLRARLRRRREVGRRPVGGPASPTT